MTLATQFPSLLAFVLFCLTLTPFIDGQQTAVPVAAAPAATVAPAATLAPRSATLPLTEDALRSRYLGKLVFLRGSYMGQDLYFDRDGKISGSPAVGSFTLSAFEVKSVKLSKHKLEIEADRYGLHFLGGLPYEDDTKPFDQVKISAKPVHIAIERELVVTPKVKKDKKQPAPPVETPADPRSVSPEQSAMLMNKALDNVFASDIDPKMLSRLPDYWQEYFNSKSQHHPFMPADAGIKTVGEGMMAPKVLNSIEPTSNEYAQQFGIAGMDLLRTVVDAAGVPRQIAIDRPIGFGLDEKAVEAVKNSRFRPATLNGQAVPVVIDLVVTFRIYSSGTRPGSVGAGTSDAVLAASVGDSNASLNR